MKREKSRRRLARHGAWFAFHFACLTVILGQTAPAEQTVTLAPRQFGAISPAAPFQSFVSDARKQAAATTPAWRSADGDLAAWGPALVFPLLDRSVARDTVVSLAAPLEAEGTAPLLMFRTLGLYAAKSRVPFAETPTLQKAVSRNLRTIEQATNDLDAFTGGPGLNGWGSIGAGAWLAYLELLYPQYWELGDPGATRWGRDGVRIVDQLLVRGVLPDGGGFRRDPRDEQLTVWPNALAIHALVQAYETTEEVKYESAAIKAAAAVETLRADGGSYYSDGTHAEKDPRANAYLAGALLLLFKDSGDVQYRERALGIVRWLTQGAGATDSAADGALAAHVAYVVLLADSLATQPFENLLGRRPMRITGDRVAPSPQVVAQVAVQPRSPEFRYHEMFDTVLRTLIEHVPQAAGDVAYDYGDAPGYAAEVLLRGGARGMAAPIIRREAELAQWPRPRNLDELSFGADALLAATQHPDAVDAVAAQASLRRYLLFSGALAFVERYYFSWLDLLTKGGGFDYGPTVIGAQVAGTQLRYAQRFPGETVGAVMHPLQVGRALLAGAERVAWDPNRHIYRTSAGSDVVALLPNAMMIIDLLEAQRVTGEAAYRARAEEVAQGLDGLWDDKRGAYFANTEQMGDDAYESLSTNSYAALALLRLSVATQQRAYRERALRIFDFINRDLYADGVIYHHLYRGRRAAGDVWCTGCNWRVVSELVELAAEH